jgi:hypothetical protein
MKTVNFFETNDFSDKAFKVLLIHDSPYFKILNFNFKSCDEHVLKGLRPDRRSVP